MAEKTTVTVRMDEDLELMLQTLCEQLECDRAEAVREAIKYFAANIHKPQMSDFTSDLMQRLDSITVQNGEIVSLLEPLQAAGGPRKLHARNVMMWTSVDELLSPDQRVSAKQNATNVLANYGLNVDGSEKEKGGE